MVKFTCSIVIEHELTGDYMQALLKGLIKLKIPDLRYCTELRIPVYHPTLIATPNHIHIYEKHENLHSNS